MVHAAAAAGRNAVLHPEVAYPTYEMGAELAGLRSVGVRARRWWALTCLPSAKPTPTAPLLLSVNTPANPTGTLTDLREAAEWGRQRGILVASDECYAEFAWAGAPSTILGSGSEGVIAVHSLSKRSNLAGCRVGFFAGDPEPVAYLSEVRRHAGLMVPGPVQYASEVALDDDEHVDVQQAGYTRRRLERLRRSWPAPGWRRRSQTARSTFWVPAPAWAEEEASSGGTSSGWALARALAEAAGMLVSPGDLYGHRSDAYVRVAAVQPDDRIELVASRIAGTDHPRFAQST